MSHNTNTHGVTPGGLVTVAFLKAQLDGGSDHLGIFMPLVFDVVARRGCESFAPNDIQDDLATVHQLAMPLPAVTTLLKRATSQRYLTREFGRYKVSPGRNLPLLDVASEKSRIRRAQSDLAGALCSHATGRGVVFDSNDAALEALFRFLEAEQVGLLLGKNPAAADSGDASQRERTVIAEFVQSVVRDDAILLSVLRGMLEGLVLYHAAFLPDLNAANRRFKNLRVVFDSTLVRQALGYEGDAMRTLMRDAINVLKGSDVQCVVLDKTIHEIKRILTLYEARLGTSQGRESLWPVPMARHLLRMRYSPSDLRQMSAMLEKDIAAIGLQVQQSPRRKPEYTSGEKALADRLSYHGSQNDSLEPRVVHDVDCVAAVLTMRAGHHTTAIEDARAVFATAAPLVIRNVRLWWSEDEHESGLEPVVHIRALANLAWLKKPALCASFKVNEMTALCAAALRPQQATWDRFLRHLETLERSNRLSSDEVTAIVISAMSDQLLKEAEFDGEDPADIDERTLDEVVERVKSSYVTEYEAKLAASNEARRLADERAERVELAVATERARARQQIEVRSTKGARLVACRSEFVTTDAAGRV